MGPIRDGVPLCEWCLTPLEDDCGCDTCDRCGGNHIEIDCEMPCPMCGEQVCDGWCDELEF